MRHTKNEAGKAPEASPEFQPSTTPKPVARQRKPLPPVPARAPIEQETPRAELKPAPEPALAAAGPAAAPPASPEPEIADLETQIGRTWALRIGLTLVAISLGLGAWMWEPMLSAGQKVGLAYAGCMALFALGKIFERRLRDFALPVMAGGLALGFFVSFAAHFVPGMKCIGLALALAWMAGGVGAVFLFADRTRSQFAAGLAIFLGHVAAYAASGKADGFSLAAIAFLALGAALLFIRRGWGPLSLFACVASYGTHLVWMLSAESGAPPEKAFWVNAAFLGSYYFIFSAADLVWQRKAARAASGAEAPVLQPAARAVAPANLACFAAMTSFVHLATGIHADEIHWFFFALAGAQALLGAAHRVWRNGDWEMYPALGVVFATFGLLSALDSLTLSAALAAEALVLLFIAHRTRIWIFYPLAQCALAVNFAHYWTVARAPGAATADFTAGALVALAYGFKAWLEERWYSPAAQADWTAGARGPVMAPLAGAFQALFPPAARLLPSLHAAGGAAILAREMLAYFPPEHAPLALAAAAAALPFAALGARSAALLFGSLFISASALYARLRLADLGQPAAYETPDLWEFWIAAAGFALPAAALAARRFMKDRIESPLALALAHLGGWTALALMAVGAGSLAESSPAFLPMLALCGAAYLAHDRLRAAARKLPDSAGGLAALLNWSSALACIAAALVAYRLVDRCVYHEYAVPLWLIALGGAAFAAGLLRLNVSFASGGALPIALAYAGLARGAWRWDHLLDHPVWTSAAIALLGGLGYALDFMLTAAGAEMKAAYRRLSAAAAFALYGLALFTAARLLEYELEFPWFIAAFAPLALALHGGASAFRMRVGMIAAWCALAAGGAAFFIALDYGAGIPAGTVAAAAVFSAFALLYERWAAAGRGFGLSYDGGDLSAPARAALVALAAALMMTCAHYAAGLGSLWTTAAWAGIGLGFMAGGFAAGAALYRRVALAVMAISLARVIGIDAMELEMEYRWIAFLALGLCLVAVSFLYFRFSDQMRRWL